MTCRICYEGHVQENNRLISVCNCSGSTGLVHEECIQKWITISRKKECEICASKWKNINVEFLQNTLETQLEAIPMLGILFGMVIAGAHALMINFQTNNWPLDYLSIILLTLMANSIHSMIWALLKRLETDLYIKIAVPTWIGVFLPLSIALEIGGKHPYMATIPYAITLSNTLVLGLLTYTKPPNVLAAPSRTHSQETVPQNPLFEHSHDLEIELVIE